jgi:hypothetical protein
MRDFPLNRRHVDAELSAAAAARTSGHFDTAWNHLERAHILSQPGPRLHTRVHLAILSLALGQGDLRELLGPVVRASVAALGSLTGRYPLGNTGRARVPLMKPMAIAAELAQGLRAAGVTSSTITFD